MALDIFVATSTKIRARWPRNRGSVPRSVWGFYVFHIQIQSDIHPACFRAVTSVLSLAVNRQNSHLHQVLKAVLLFAGDESHTQKKREQYERSVGQKVPSKMDEKSWSRATLFHFGWINLPEKKNTKVKNISQRVSACTVADRRLSIFCWLLSFFIVYPFKAYWLRDALTV